jgi:phage shock protein C
MLSKNLNNNSGMKLAKSDESKVLFGVCGGLAEYFGWDPALIRIGFSLCTILGVGSPLLIYFILAVVMPRHRYY